MLKYVSTIDSFGRELKQTAPEPKVRARYDNAQNTDENRRSWWASDYFSAKSANSFQVRRLLRMRSRYEVANNPYLFGITNGNASDLISTGPTLQVNTPNKAYNREVEARWREWCDEVDLVEKLKTQKLAKEVDGEGFLVLKTVPDMEHPVKLYPCDLEADQVTTPAPANLADLWVDGLTLHPITGRPTSYHVLRHHPGDMFFPDFNPLRVDVIQKRYVLHWFRKFRPGQVRGIPVFTSSLDLFTELRAYRRSVLKAAEVAADFAAVLESEVPGGMEDEFMPFERTPIDRGMMTTLPKGMKLSQFDAKQPTGTYADFHEHGLAEACRPLSYPLNLALGSSQKFNFSSTKLDHIIYRNTLVDERDECGRVNLEPIFRAWFEEATLVGLIAFFDGLRLPPREWHWPGFEPLDATVDADADHSRLSNGTKTWREYWAKRGYDWRDVMRQQAEEQQEIERLGIEFGQPATKSITESTETDEEGNPKPKATNRIKRHFKGSIRATKDDNGQEHDADGKFGSGGGSHHETHEKWRKEDEEHDATAEKKTDETRERHAKEESEHERAGNRIEQKHDREDRDVERSRRREDDKGPNKEEKEELKGLDKQRKTEEKEMEKRQAKEIKEHDKIDDKIENDREKEHDAHEKEHDAEDERIQNRAVAKDTENENHPTRTDAEKAEHQKILDKQYEEEAKEHAEKFEKRDDEIDSKHDERSKINDDARAETEQRHNDEGSDHEEKHDKIREEAEERQERDREERRAKEDEEREARQGAEKEAHDEAGNEMSKRQEKEIASLEDAHDASAKERYLKRHEEDGGAHADYYSRDEHENYGTQGKHYDAPAKARRRKAVAA